MAQNRKKECCKCGKIKEPNKQTTPYCKTCSNENHKIWYQNNKEKCKSANVVAQNKARKNLDASYVKNHIRLCLQNDIKMPVNIKDIPDELVYPTMAKILFTREIRRQTNGEKNCDY